MLVFYNREDLPEVLQDDQGVAGPHTTPPLFALIFRVVHVLVFPHLHPENL